MILTEQELRDKADIVFTDNTPGAITAAVWSDFAVDDFSDSLVAKDDGIHYVGAVGNYDSDIDILIGPTPLFALVNLSVSVPHYLGCPVEVFIFDENNILQDESFYFAEETDANNLLLTFYREPDYLHFFKLVIQGI